MPTTTPCSSCGSDHGDTLRALAEGMAARVSGYAPSRDAVRDRAAASGWTVKAAGTGFTVRKGRQTGWALFTEAGVFMRGSVTLPDGTLTIATRPGSMIRNLEKD